MRTGFNVQNNNITCHFQRYWIPSIDTESASDPANSNDEMSSSDEETVGDPVDTTLTSNISHTLGRYAHRCKCFQLRNSKKKAFKSRAKETIENLKRKAMFGDGFIHRGVKRKRQLQSSSAQAKTKKKKKRKPAKKRKPTKKPLEHCRSGGDCCKKAMHRTISGSKLFNSTLKEDEIPRHLIESIDSVEPIEVDEEAYVVEEENIESVLQIKVSEKDINDISSITAAIGTEHCDFDVTYDKIERVELAMQVTSMWTAQKLSPWHWREAILTLIGQVDNYDDWNGFLHHRCNMLCHKFLNLCTPGTIDPQFDYMEMTMAATPSAAKGEENVTSDVAITATTESHAGPQKDPVVEVGERIIMYVVQLQMLLIAMAQCGVSSQKMQPNITTDDFEVIPIENATHFTEHLGTAGVAG
ncbi:hypothetical protein Bhyg_13165 [Pseudolycoriella hygida]|uniref:Uncharacterized protein n=1 Tax=Pseudolycoriella hygida TaxID=35572 RepID=A0A9Q0MP25_9DIPT|nr:hypothetical protein Bhyg_13165 [Pseudolycoriella hygida]